MTAGPSLQDFNPFSHLRAAATGDIAAQRLLADAAVQMAAEYGLDEDPLPYVQDGLIFARLAAAHGNDDDKGRLISMLAIAAELCGDERSNEFSGEALAVAELVAEAGNDLMSDLLPQVVEKLNPEVVAMAQGFRERMITA